MSFRRPSHDLGFGRLSILAGIALLVIGLAPGTAAGKPHRPGSPDRAYGPGGFGVGLVSEGQFANGLDSFGGMALRPDGRVTLAGNTVSGGNGDFAIGRLRGNGFPDESFGDPVNHVSVGDILGDDVVNAIAAGPGASTFLTTQSSSVGIDRIGVAKVDANGSFDNGFDGDGRTTTTIGTEAQARAIAVQKDGKVVVAGSGNIAGTTDVAVVRYLPSGAPDPSFGGGDGFITRHIGVASVAFDLAVQKDGKIVVSGSDEFNASSDSEAFAARFKANGDPDSGFGSGGVARIRQGNTGIAFSLAVGSAGKIVLAGLNAAGSKPTGFVARLTAAGRRDKSFGGGDGVTRTNFRLGFSYPTSVALQRNGKIVVAGIGGDIPGIVGGTLVARLTADGRLDREFADRGSRLFLLGATGFSFVQVAIQPNGRIIVAGDFTVSGEVRGLFAARLFGDPVG